MLTEIRPVRVETPGANSATERAAEPRQRVTSNTLILICGMVILFLFLFCRELHIRSSAVRLTSFHGNAVVEESSNPNSLYAG